MDSKLLAEIKSLIRGLLISTPNATTIGSLKKDYMEQVGEPIPFYKFGFKDLLSFLQSLDDTVMLDFNTVLNSYTILPVRSEKSAHVEDLVMKQKVSQPASRRTSRSYQFQGFPIRRQRPLRRPPAVVKKDVPKSIKSPLTYVTKCNITDFVSLHSEGVPVHIVAARYFRDMQTTADEAENMLREIDSLEVRNRMVYAIDRRNPGRMESSKVFFRSEQPLKDTRSDNSYIMTNHHPIRENGYSCREKEIARPDYSYEPVDLWEDVESDADDDINEMIDTYSGGFWEVDEPQGGSQPVYTSNTEGSRVVMGHSSTPKNNISSNNFVPKFNSVAPSNGLVRHDSLDSPSGSYSNLISKRAEENIRYLLLKHPKGIFSSQFDKKYQEEFGSSFKPSDFGFVSIIQMARSLRHLFKMINVNGTSDFILFEAKASIPDQCFVNTNPVVPSNVRTQILELLNRHPSGLQSSQLEELYEASYGVKLNPTGMGFADLESFFMAMFDDVSLKYVNSKIYIHPKIAKWADLLTDPPLPPKSAEDVLDGLNKYYPVEALRLDYVLPHEPLPPDLKPKSLLSILVLDVVSPSQWYFLKYENSTPFEDFMDELQVFYNAEGSSLKMHPKTVLQNHLCVAEYVDPNVMSRDWCRARIKKINQDDTVELFFIDYGSRGTAKISDLKYLHQNYATYPAQAFKGTMYGIKPPNGKKNWPEQSCRMLLNLVTAKGIQAEVVQVDYQNFKVAAYLVDTNTTEDIILSSILIEKGLAEISLYEAEEERRQPQEDKPEEPPFTVKSMYSQVAELYAND